MVFYWRKEQHWLLDEDCNFQAWPYGPVLADVYYEFCNQTNGMYSQITSGARWSQDKQLYSYDKGSPVASMATKVLKLFQNISDIDISGITHAIESPWAKADFRQKAKIPATKIQEYFDGDQLTTDLACTLGRDTVSSFLNNSL